MRKIKNWELRGHKVVPGILQTFDHPSSLQWTNFYNFINSKILGVGGEGVINIPPFIEATEQ